MRYKAGARSSQSRTCLHKYYAEDSGRLDFAGAEARLPFAAHPRTMRTKLLSTVLRTTTRPALISSASRASPLVVRYSSSHAEESFEAFSERYVKFFQNAEDLFEVQRGLNNCFAHDLVPSASVVEAALRASRRVNDYSTAVRIFEGIKEKVENKEQYKAYLDELKPVRDELGWSTKFFVMPDPI